MSECKERQLCKGDCGRRRSLIKSGRYSLSWCPTGTTTKKMSQNTLTLYRTLLKEIRTLHPKEKLFDIPAYQYVRNQFKNHKITTELLCKGKHEVKYVAETYLCLLQSVKKYEELHKLYKGGADRSLESTANLVGLQLPKTYNPDKKD